MCYILLLQVFKYQVNTGGYVNMEITIRPRIQVIYYQLNDDTLGQANATSESRITLKEAEEILHSRKIDFKSVLKVKYEFVLLQFQPNEFKKFIIEEE